MADKAKQDSEVIDSRRSTEYVDLDLFNSIEESDERRGEGAQSEEERQE